MLTDLHIRDVGVIDEVTLRLGPGLNVLTGETGAGKTMVVSALELLLGARADADRVRAGADAAIVDGVLAPPPPTAAEWVEGVEELVVSREVTRDRDGGSRSRARIQGRLAPVSALTAALAEAVELHGQSDTTRFAEPSVQRDLLDRFGGEDVAAALEAYQRTHAAWQAANRSLAALRDESRDRVRELDRLRFELAEIDAVDPVPGEDAELDDELRRAEHAEALVEAARSASGAIADDGGGRDALGVAVAALRRVEGVDADLEALRRRVEGIAAEAQDVALELGAYADAVDLDPERLSALRERRMALAGLTRKYGVDAAAVVTYAIDARKRLADLDGGEERIGALEAELAALAQQLDADAERLRARRRSAGVRLATAVEGHLGELAMAAARFTVAVEPADHGPSGADRVAFLLAANAGERALPVAKAASGGERSRVALALRLALVDADDTPVLVFDEVDAGIGGAVALEVGRKLARLARGRQVLCVTHLAQLAAFADVHFVVAKREEAGRTRASVHALGEPERVGELSRMLSGTPDSAAAAEHAAELRAMARSVDAS